MAAKDVPVRNALLLDGILERAGNVFLPDDIGELLWTIFAGENLVAHRQKLRLYGLKLWNGSS